MRGFVFWKPDSWPQRKGLVRPFQFAVIYSASLTAAALRFPMNPNLSAQEKELYAAIGLAHTKWAELEDMLCHVFCEAVNPQNWTPSDSVFWEPTSFELRLDMTDTAIQRRFWRPERPDLPDRVLSPLEQSADALLTDWKKVRQRTAERNRGRNKLAHGSVATLEGELVYVPYFYGELRKRSHVYVPESGARILSSLPERKLRHNKHNVLSISRGFQIGTERLRRFLLALRAHNRAQSSRDAEANRFSAEAQAQANRTSTNSRPPPAPSQG